MTYLRARRFASGSFSFRSGPLRAASHQCAGAGFELSRSLPESPARWRDYAENPLLTFYPAPSF
jgi:hypothetical protein